MPAKTPIYLKSSHGKGSNLKNSKKLRDMLSTDMISPPLGDFRHMAHIGRGGDEDRFGDISFMKKPAVENGGGTFKRAASWGRKKRTASASHATATLDRQPRKRNGMEVKSTDNLSSRSGLESPILKNAVSLPSLKNEEGSSVSSTPPDSPKSTNNNTIENGKVDERLSPKKANEQYAEHGTPVTNGTLEGPPKPRRIMADNEPESNIDKNKLSPLRRSSEVISKHQIEDDDNWELNLDFDLGPSLLDEVLGVMDRVCV